MHNLGYMLNALYNKAHIITVIIECSMNTAMDFDFIILYNYYSKQLL